MVRMALQIIMVVGLITNLPTSLRAAPWEHPVMAKTNKAILTTDMVVQVISRQYPVLVHVTTDRVKRLNTRTEHLVVTNTVLMLPIHSEWDPSPRMLVLPTGRELSMVDHTVLQCKARCQVLSHQITPIILGAGELVRAALLRHNSILAVHRLDIRANKSPQIQGYKPRQGICMIQHLPTFQEDLRRCQDITKQAKMTHETRKIIGHLLNISIRRLHERSLLRLHRASPSELTTPPIPDVATR